MNGINGWMRVIEIGEPIPYRYLTSGVYRGTCAWNMVYQIEAPPGNESITIIV